jgi:hypothetical protein
MADRAPAPLARLAARLAARRWKRAPREFLLVAAFCRQPADAARARAVAAAAEGVDWRQVFRLVDRHRLWGHARQALTQAGIVPPPLIEAQLAARVAAMTRRNLASAAETARLCGLLREAEIDAIFLKGATLEAALYGGDFSIKHSRDIDILVAPAQLHRARALLEGAGYVLDPPLPPLPEPRLALLLAHSPEWEFRDSARGSVVELHWLLAKNDRLIPGLGLASPRQETAIAGVAVPTFAREELFVYLCAHGAQHRWSRLKWLADLAAMLAQETDAGDIERLYRAAERQGAGRCAGQALLLSERLLGATLPGDLAAKLRDGAASLLEAVALEAMIGVAAQSRRQPTLREIVFAMASLSLIGDARGFLTSELRRYLIAPADVAALPLPPRMAWLYIALRLPLWALRRFAGGARSRASQE